MVDKNYLFNISYIEYEKIFSAYKEFLKSFEKGKYYKNVEYMICDNCINAWVVRCNEYYITNDMVRNNDYLVILHYLPDKVNKYVFNCTADPKTRRQGIANLVEQIYFGNIRNHKWTLGRDCIAQDKCKVWVRRYINKFKFYEEEGHFGINIHNNGGLFNSSLGCVIFADDKDYFNYFRKVLRQCANRNYVPVAVIRDKLLIELKNKIQN